MDRYVSITLFGKKISAELTRLDQGVQVLVAGGDLSHVGAVSIVDPEGHITTTQFPGHRDGVVSRRWAEALAETGNIPAVVTAGIHYDNLSREGIQAVLDATEKLLKELIGEL